MSNTDDIHETLLAALASAGMAGREKRRIFRKKFFIILAYGFAQAWVGMIALGMIAGYIAVPGLAIGYWATFVVTTLLTWAFSGDISRVLDRMEDRGEL